MKFYQKKLETVLSDLKTNLNTGLDEKEINIKQEQYGQNIIKETQKTSAFKILIKQFLSPLMFILLIAASISFFVGEVKDALVISIAVLLNVIIGFIQEWKADKSAQALKKYEVLYCNVIRDSKQTKIEAKNLVPGDIVILTAGQKIPADIRLAHLTSFKVDESLLTGESRPVEKNISEITQDVTIGDRKNMAFSGTNVLNGKGIGIVIAIGTNTQLGKIATMVSQTKQIETPLQEQIKKLSWILGGFFLFIIFIVFILGLIKGISFYEIAMLSIALGVASIPEGLLIAVTVILAIGMQKMLKRKALVRHLIAAETLGSVSVICTDKTGTLTQGHMKVTKIITKENEFSLDEKNNNLLNHQDLKNIILASIINNDAQLEKDSQKTIGHPTEIALLQLANDLNINIKSIKDKYKRIDEIPFSSDLKYMATIHQFDDHQKLTVKGAPEKIFGMCNQNNIEYFKKSAEKMALEGFRILAFAQKENHKFDFKKDLTQLELIGLVGIEDPLRPETKDTIEELSRAGITIVLVTGDHKETAKNIAIKAGIKIKDGTITGEELDKMSDKQLKDKIKDTTIFARVDPRHKIKIVEAWKSIGKSVAMIGDGVNDAPALKAADIGVALGSGSDVAHDISDIVLLDNNLSSIDAAVKEGRTIFENIRKVIVYLMTDSFGEIVLITGSLIANLPIPITAMQILWINIISDGLPYLGLAKEPAEEEIMLKPPRNKNESIINKEMILIIFFVGILTDLILFIIFIYFLKLNLQINHIRTIIFNTLSINSLFYIFSLRSLNKSIFKINIFSNKWIVYPVIIGLIAQISVTHIPILQKLLNTVSLNSFEWFIILSLSLIKITGIEIIKYFFIKK
ncbi:MAG: HAD-IC family P-type ATPase [bacterium]